ncbi:hypothetical protein GCM10009678_32370 [Actinomadura kijaniata]|uniref:DUF3052 domain-containing protein n=1 Tax=Actinomadura namibiensis TaxID=182080 RepID=A0A7W3LI76_ACTNM|nr:hypothetical protein [Actinomadura namibiensis]MBA8948622.1 hypothetical protein [Actinomadura namibiensis]
MSNKTVAEKLGYKPGCTILAINAPEDYTSLVGGLPDGAELCSVPPAGAVHLFAADHRELNTHLGDAIAAVEPGGLLWVSYPKDGASDITRDNLWPAFVPYGLRPVRQVSVDARWSAIRFRPEGDVKISMDRWG